MGPKVNRYPLDPAEPSGRDDWWIVNNGMVTRTGVIHSATNWKVHLERYVVERAEAGCADCISAILECPNDAWLVDALKKLKENEHG